MTALFRPRPCRLVAARPSRFRRRVAFLTTALRIWEPAIFFWPVHSSGEGSGDDGALEFFVVRGFGAFARWRFGNGERTEISRAVGL
jgi:hypothetical protein